ncbi:hypothetical protein J1614_005883 [Plenodomus biglobosus]|nr:hypothetical protein J1614_005883 [Plenodomus biglobosus]
MSATMIANYEAMVSLSRTPQQEGLRRVVMDKLSNEELAEMIRIGPKPQSLRASLEEAARLSFAATLEAERDTGHNSEEGGGVDRHNTGQQDSGITVVPRRSTDKSQRRGTPFNDNTRNAGSRRPMTPSSYRGLRRTRYTHPSALQLRAVPRALQFRVESATPAIGHKAAVGEEEDTASVDELARHTPAPVRRTMRERRPASRLTQL